MGAGVRYFRATAAVYEQVRAALNEAWGYPDPVRKTLSAIAPASTRPKDSAGRVYISVPSEFCEFEAVAALLPPLLESGAVEEVSEQAYRALFPPRRPRPQPSP